MKNFQKLRILLIAIILILIKACTNNPETNLETNSKIEQKNRGKRVLIGINIDQKDIRLENQKDKITIPILIGPNEKTDTTSIYGVKIWKKSSSDASQEYTPYLSGLFEYDKLDSIKFHGYNLEKYKVEATLIDNQTKERELYYDIQSDVKFYKFPFNTALLNNFNTENTANFKPADYLSSMRSDTAQQQFLNFNHAELQRFYGITTNFQPDTVLADEFLTVDLYRVSFGLEFEILGKQLSPNQHIRVAVDMGKGAETGGLKKEIYTYILSESARNSEKIIAHGSSDNQLHENFYTTMYNNTDYTETFKAEVFLETIDEKTKEIKESILVATTDNLEAKRNRRITYQLTIEDHSNNVHILFNKIDKAWQQETRPFPK